MECPLDKVIVFEQIRMHHHMIRDLMHPVNLIVTGKKLCAESLEIRFVLSELRCLDVMRKK